jgi:hypothetical protein
VGLSLAALLAWLPVAHGAPRKRADAGVPSAGEQPASDVRSALAQLATIEALDAQFREEKRMALLAQPLVSEGELHYEKPRLLARHTRPPHASSVLLRGETLSFGDDQHKESIELSAQPALRVLVDTFVSVLGGDVAALERVAELKYEPLPNDGYRIRVLPRDEKMKRLVRSMFFEGQGTLLSKMELVDANGDTTVTTFTRVTVRKPYSAAEQARLFRIGR